MQKRRMRKSVVFLALLLTATLGMGLGAGAVEYTGYYDASQADFVETLQMADCIVEVTVKSIETRLRWDGPEAEGKMTMMDVITFSYDELIYGNVEPPTKTGTVTRENRKWKKVEVGETIVLGLKIDEKNEKNPYELTALGTYYENGAIVGQWDEHGYYGFKNAQELIDQIEGRVESEGFRTEDIYVRCTTYDGMILYRCYLNQNATVYTSPFGDGEKVLTLKPYDWVLKVGGGSNYVDGYWQPILLSDGTLGYIKGRGSMTYIAIETEEPGAKLLAVTKTTAIRDIAGKKYAVGRLVEGTAVMSYPSALEIPAGYTALFTGMQNHVLVPEADYPEIKGSAGVELKWEEKRYSDWAAGINDGLFGLTEREEE